MILVLVFSLIPFKTAFAYNEPEGLLENPGVTVTGWDSPNYKYLNDNNTATSYYFDNAQYDVVRFTLPEAKTIESLYQNSTQYYRVDYRFYDSAGTMIHRENFSMQTYGGQYFKLSKKVEGVKKIEVQLYNSNVYVYEVEFYETDIAHPNITNLTTRPYTTETLSTWTAPQKSTYTGTRVYRDGVLLTAVSKDLPQQFKDTGLSPDTTYNYKFVAYYSDGQVASGVETTVKTEPIPPKDNLTKVSYTSTWNELKFTWENPNNSYFNGTEIYRDGNLITTLGKYENSYSVGGLTPETTYNYKFVATYTDGGKSPGVELKAVTKAAPIMKELINLDYTSTPDSLKFTWDDPSSLDYKYNGVEIYKDGQLIETLDNTKSSYTVTGLQPENKYNYRFVALYTNGLKSPGKDIAAETSAEKTPVLKVGMTTKNNDGSYTFTWTEPTTGTVKVMNGEQEFSIVDAALKKVTIPKDEIVFDSLGNPEVSLIPISEYGTKTGGAVKVKGDNLEIPFTVNDLILSGNSLLWYVGPLILLALAFLLVPKLRNLVFSAFKGTKEERAAAREQRRTEKEERQKRERAATQEREARERTTREPRITKARRERNRVERFRLERTRTERNQEERVRPERTRRETNDNERRFKL